MALRIGSDRHLKAHVGGVQDQFGGRSIAAGRGFVRRIEAGWRIAAQGHDVAHAGGMIVAKRLANFITCGADTGQMRRGLHRRLARHAFDQRVGALAGRTAGAVSDRHEGGIQWLEARGRFPQVRLHVRVFRREKLERDMNLRPGAAQRKGFRSHQANSVSLFRKSSEMTRGSSAIHSATVSLPASPLAGGTRSRRMAARPASAR